VLGVFIFALAVWVLVNYGIRGERDSGSVGVSLICFGLLFAATFTTGRVNSGLHVAFGSQYTTFDLMIVAGCYLALLHPPASRRQRWRPARSTWTNLRLVASGVVVAQIGFGTANGITTASQTHTYQITISDITANIDRAPVSLVDREVLQTPAWIHQVVHIAKAHRLSLFSTSAAAAYRKQGLFPEFSTVQTEIIVPADGAAVSSNVALDAVVVADAPATKVVFEITDQTGRSVLVARARPSLTGWIYLWDTTNVANGTYTVRVEGFLAGRKPSYSAPRSLTVENG
jgi:hypothetical protein